MRHICRCQKIAIYRKCLSHNNQKFIILESGNECCTNGDKRINLVLCICIMKSVDLAFKSQLLYTATYNLRALMHVMCVNQRNNYKENTLLPIFNSLLLLTGLKNWFFLVSCALVRWFNWQTKAIKYSYVGINNKVIKGV